MTVDFRLILALKPLVQVLRQTLISLQTDEQRFTCEVPILPMQFGQSGLKLLDQSIQLGQLLGR